jgi:hypothetical protein
MPLVARALPFPAVHAHPPNPPFRPPQPPGRAARPQVLVEKTVNPDTGRPYTHTMLERALRELHFNPDPKKSAKQQALEASAPCRTCGFCVRASPRSGQAASGFGVGSPERTTRGRGVRPNAT